MKDAAGFVDPTWHELAAPDHVWMQWRLRAALWLVADLGLSTTRPLAVLDVGCGAGVLAGQLERCTGWHVDGVDVCWPTSPDASNPEASSRDDRAPRRGRRVLYDVRDEAPEWLGRYDVALLFDVLEHVEDTASLVRSVLRHLAPTGVLLVNVPAIPALRSRYDEAVGHLRRYTARSLRAAIERAGAEVVEVRPWGISLVVPLALRALWTGRREMDDAVVVRRGFAEPGALLSAVLRLAMKLELRLAPRPPAGASLLLAARPATAPGPGPVVASGGAPAR